MSNLGKNNAGRVLADTSLVASGIVVRDTFNANVSRGEDKVLPAVTSNEGNIFQGSICDK